MPAYNMRFGAMAAEARHNGSTNLKEPCAAERLVEAATSPSRCLVVCNGRESGGQSCRNRGNSTVTYNFEYKFLFNLF